MVQKISYHAKTILENGGTIVLAKVIKTEGSTPRKSGAWMFMNDDFTTTGTVGGGKLEAEVTRICRETFETKQDQIYHFKLNTTDPDALNMGCGGDADVSIEYIDPEHVDKFQEYIEKSVAYVFGAGHVSLALDPILRSVNFKTVIIDDREEYANRERFPEAEDVMVIDSFEDSFKNIKTDQDSYIIIVTRGHQGDYDVLKHALKQDRAYLGMIGSKKKNNLLYDKLRDAGVAQADIDKIYAPIGTEIHAETPEEIAISIVGEMINVRAGYGK